MRELSGRAGDWLGWRRTMDSMLWGQAWGEGTVALGRPEEKEPDTGWAGAGAGDEDAQARALLRPAASGTEVTGSREPVVTAWG